MAQKHQSKWERLLGRTESPIELLFLDAFCRLCFEHGYEVGRRNLRSVDAIIVEPQKRIGVYRADFLISYSFAGALLALVVECDGHEFHDKTKLQAARDKRRDRHLIAAGATCVLRFTGTEITRAPSTCAMEVLDLIMTFQTECVPWHASGYSDPNKVA